jgi:hypothetical protein
MKKTAKGFVLGFIAACLTITPLFAFADSIQASFNTVNINLNGKQIASKGQSYTLENGTALPYSLNYSGTVYLPIRKVSELIGKDISYDSQTSTVNISDKANPVNPVQTTESAVQTTGPAVQTPPADVKDTTQNNNQNVKEESGFAVINSFPKMVNSSGAQVNELTGLMGEAVCSMQTSQKDMISYSETPALYKIKYKGSVITAIEKVSSDKEDTVTAGSSYNLATNAVFYEFQKEDDGSFDGYRITYSNLNAGDKVYLYDVASTSGYDVVIVVRK